MAVPVQPHHWRHALESSAVAAAATWLIAAAGGRLHLILILAAALAVTLATFTATMIITERPMVAWYFGAWGCVISGWLTWTRTGGVSPWTATAIVALLAPVAILAPGGALVWAHHTHRAALALPAADAAAAELLRWSAFMDEIGFAGVTATLVTRGRSGRTIHFRLPRDGHLTAADLNRGTERIEIAQRWARGTVRFEDSPGSAADVIMHIGEDQILSELVPFPDELTPLTINRALQLGVISNGDEVAELFREIATLLVGVRGSGKTNLLNVIIAQLSRCVDVVIFMIDLKGGRAAAPWVKPWMNGECPRPVIDWIATDREEADLMLTAILAAIQARARSLSGGEKVIPAAKEPAIIVVADEVAVMFDTTAPRSQTGVSNRTLAFKAGQITQLGRSEAIDPVWCSLRGTVSTVPSDIKSQCDLRFGLGTATVAEAMSLAPDDPRATKIMSKLSIPGTGLRFRKGTPPVVAKWFRLDPDRIEAIAAVTGYIRPEPDPVLVEAMGTAYSQRWERARPLIDAWSASTATQRFDEQFGQIVAGLPDPEHEARLHPAHARLRELLAAAGRTGSRPSLLHSALKREGHDVARETVQRWLAADGRAGLATSATHGRWVSTAPARPGGA